MSPNGAQAVRILQHHQTLCLELLAVVEQESRELQAALTTPSPKSTALAPGSSAFDFYQRRKRLLPQLDQSNRDLQRERAWWQGLHPSERKQYQQIDPMIRSNQDLVMKIVVLDRENEKARLRLGLVPPNRWPSAASQRPHFVADLYRRHTAPQS